MDLFIGYSTSRLPLTLFEALYNLGMSSAECRLTQYKLNMCEIHPGASRNQLM
jgi:hypothetical protein